MKRPVIYGTLLFLFWIALTSWGFLVHRTVNQLAVYELPKAPRVFFHRNMDYIVKHSVRPDLRRNEDSTEDTKHFINFEAFGDSAAWKMPVTWEEAVRKYSKDSLLKHGYVPYYIVMMKNRLTNAFKNKNTDSILFYAADLAHYIGDAHVPLHTTLNYDGQLTNQKGLHSLWESTIPEIELDQFNLSSRHKARYLKHPDEVTWQVVRDAYVLTTNVFLQEKEASATFTDSTKYRVQVRRGKEVRSYTSEFAKAYYLRLGGTVNRQLIKAADLIADFWYTSWVDAGRPDLKTLNGNELTDQQKQTLKKECEAFKKNRLLSEKLLISRQSQTTTNY
jgi:S1/P1 Nuclease